MRIEVLSASMANHNTSILKAFPIDFIRQGNYSYPADRELHRMAVEFSEKELAKPANLSEYAKVWAACEMDGEKIEKVVGLMGFAMRPDITLARFMQPDAITLLHDRAQAYFADQGCRGAEVLFYMNSNEAPEQRCPQGLQTMLKLGALPADRWVVKVR